VTHRAYVVCLYVTSTWPLNLAYPIELYAAEYACFALAVGAKMEEDGNRPYVLTRAEWIVF
jgi:hypothetical protein